MSELDLAAFLYERRQKSPTPTNYESKTEQNGQNYQYSPFLARSKYYQENHEELQKYLQQQNMQRLKSLCPFEPMLVHDEGFLNGMQFSKFEVRCADDITRRKSRLEMLKANILKDRIEKESKSCTFRPEISDKAKMAKPRYLPDHVLFAKKKESPYSREPLVNYKPNLDMNVKNITR
jgi:hypothetical protein